MNNSPKPEYDVIIVGGGSAGCVLASRLSEDATRTVLLLEAGSAPDPGAYPPDLADIGRLSVEPQYTWGYQSAGMQPAHSLAAYAGRVLGGTSAINGGISRRARPSDFARWEQHGLPEWSFSNVLETYKMLENMPTGEEAWHGRGGRWPIRQLTVDELSTSVRTFVDTAAAAGFARISDFNGAAQEGIGPEIKNVVGGIRQNTAMTYLAADVRARPNLSIRAIAQVDRIGFEAKRATTVHLVGGEQLRAGEIVLTAGVYGSPAILLRSGIGPADHLRQYGIELVADLPVGQRLIDQPLYTLLYTMQPEVPSVPPDGSACLWTRSAEAGAEELDLQLSISVMPSFDPAGPQLTTFRIWAAVVLPRSTGTVGLKSRDPRITPAIEYDLLADPADRRRLREVIRLARRLVQTAPLRGLIEQELRPGPAVETDAQLDAAIDASLTTYYHGCGTAPMGGDHDPAAVVDAQGRVRRVQGLRVADAAIFPEAISTPPNLTVILVAERIAAAMRVG